MHQPAFVRSRVETPHAPTTTHRRKALALLVALTVATGSFVAVDASAARADDPTPSQPAPVTIADPALAACAQTALGTANFTTENLASITTLTCSGVADVSAITNFTGLTDLNLTGGTISAVAPLVSLTNLTTLVVSNNHISDLSPLSTMRATVVALKETVTGPTRVVGQPYAAPIIRDQTNASVPLTAGTGTGATLSPDGATVTPTTTAGGTLTWGGSSASFSGTYSFAATPGVILSHGPSTIAGTPRVGATLSAVPTTWDAGVALSYQWLRDGVAIAGATSSTYTLVAADDAHQITVRTTGSKSSYASATDLSPAVTIGAGVLTPGQPTLSGTPLVFQKLTVSPGIWAPTGVTFTYQWFRGGVRLTGAQASTYVIQPADSGKSITATVTGTKAGYTSVAHTTAAVVPKLNSIKTAPTPTITGTRQVTKKVGLSLGTWSPSGIAFTYQWYLNGAKISKATASTYTLPITSAGSSITATVTATKPGYTTVVRTAAAFRPTTLTFPKSTLPVISGSATIDHTVTAKVGAWSPSGIAFTYQWKRSGTSISGATHSTYVITASDVKKAITVTVTAKKTGYATLARTSKAVTPPAGTITTAPTPSISGTSTPGHVLTANLGTWQSGVTVTVQWRRNGVAISGATSRTYTVRSTDVGAAISLVAKGTKAGYTSVSKAAAGKSVPVTAYANCDALNAVYPHGVARVGVTYDLVSGRHEAVAAGTYFNTALYNANPNRDRDKDGIACEQR